MVNFTDQKQKCSERWKNKFDFFFFLRASKIKSWEKSKNISHWLPLDLLFKGKKTQHGRMGGTALPMHVRVKIFFLNLPILLTGRKMAWIEKVSLAIIKCY